MSFRRVLMILGSFLWLAVGARAQGPMGPLQSAKPWLGVAIDRGPRGVLIKSILPGTPAEGAGLKPGDEITVVDSTVIKEPKELIHTVQSQGVGNTVTVHIWRGDKAQAVPIKLVARPDEQEMIRKQLVGRAAPPFNLKVIGGPESGSSDKLKGNVVVVEFWATWCPACRSTHSRLSEFARSHRQKGVAVVAISDEEEAPLKVYIKAVQPAFTVLTDPTHATQGAWMVSAIPELAVIDKKGNVAFLP